MGPAPLRPGLAVMPADQGDRCYRWGLRGSLRALRAAASMPASFASSSETSMASPHVRLCVHKRLLRDTIVTLGGGAVPLLSVTDDIAVMVADGEAARAEPLLPISPAAITKNDSG